MSEESSQTDQNTNQPGGLNKKTLAASAMLLVLPAAIPLFFISQTDEPVVIGIFVGTSVVLVLLNVVLLVGISRWLKRMVNQNDTSQDN